MENLKHLSIADLKAIIQILEEKKDDYRSITASTAVMRVELQKQKIEDYLDVRLKELGIKI